MSNGFAITLMIPDLTPAIQQGVRDVLVRDIGDLWDDYCEGNDVSAELYVEGIKFLTYFASKINEPKATHN